MSTFCGAYGAMEINMRAQADLIPLAGRGDISHAYIFYGENNSTGALAHSFVKALLCESVASNIAKPCNQCKPCKTFQNANNTDISYITSDKTTTGINLVREAITKPISIKPYGKHKVFILNNASSLTISAQNALLKTLEEPPHYATIILLADSTANFLPTLMSRCALVRCTDAEHTNVDMLVSVSNFLINLSTQSLNDVFNSYKFLEEQKDDIVSILNGVQVFFRDCMLYASKQSAHRLITNIDILDNIATYTNNTSLHKLIKQSEAVSDTITALQHNANFQLACELMLIKIRQA